MDSCTLCAVKGNIEKCVAATCYIHKSWYVAQLKKQIEDLSNKTEGIGVGKAISA